MKILMVSYSGYGAWFTLRFQREGHKVDYYLIGDKYTDVLRGIVPKPLKEKPDFSRYDLVLFDLTGRPKLAEQSAKVAPTIGDGNIHSELEDNRLFGIEAMEECGIEVPFYEVFDSVDTARKFVEKTKKRFVFKPNGGQDQETASTYVSTSAEDMLNYFDELIKMSHGAEFILQEVVPGTEISTEAYFNGDDFFLVNATLEEKKFMEGNKGPNTGCSGNLVWVYDNKPKIFTRGLELLKPFLQDYGFVGMVDLNTIASDSHLYGLEWTPRFGYDASATLFALVDSDLGEFFHSIATGGHIEPSTNNSFAAAIRLSIPPYPSECEGFYHAGVPIQGIEEDDIRSCYLYDAMLDGADLVTAGCSGFIAVPIGCGRSIDEAFAVVKEKVKKIRIPDMQYRNDIGKTTKGRYEELSRMGWLRA